MESRTKHFFVILGLVVSISLILPWCCHAMSGSSVTTPDQGVSQSAATPHLLAGCTCGHQLKQDYISAANKYSPSLQGPSSPFLLRRFSLPSGSELQSSLLASVVMGEHASQVSLHILYSVFLN